jgi:hypothetical protein
MRAPLLAARGTTVFASDRPTRYGLTWGNYNTTCIDTVDPRIFWTYQEFATSNAPSRYTTCWVAFRFQ